MNAQSKVRVIEEKARRLDRQVASVAGVYPSDVVDLIIYHKLHLSLPMESALRSFRGLKTVFVDWNEVRVSSVREIQEALVKSPESLPIAVFVKELLELVHRQQQSVSLEFLVEQNLADIRKYLKQVRGMDSSTVNLILRIRKEHPVLPLNRAMEAVLDRVGLLRTSPTRDKRERALHELVEPDRALLFHHFLLNHSQERCPPEETDLDCAHCTMRRMCAFFNAVASRGDDRSTQPHHGSGGAKNGASKNGASNRGAVRSSPAARGASRRSREGASRGRRGRSAARKGSPKNSRSTQSPTLGKLPSRAPKSRSASSSGSSSRTTSRATRSPSARSTAAASSRPHSGGNGSRRGSQNSRKRAQDSGKRGRRSASSRRPPGAGSKGSSKGSSPRAKKRSRRTSSR